MRVRRRLLLLLVPLAVLAVLAVGTLYWGQQQHALVVLANQQRDDAVASAATAQSQAVQAEASLTAVLGQQAAAAGATATVVAQAAAPRQALESALGQLFIAYQQPVGTAYDQLSQSFGPDALSVVRQEADYLRSAGNHLGGTSTFTVNSDAPVSTGPDTVTIHTTETWVYDELDDANQRQRCFSETTSQTYSLRRTTTGSPPWLVTNVQLEGGASRKNC